MRSALVVQALASLAFAATTVACWETTERERTGFVEQRLESSEG